MKEQTEKSVILSYLYENLTKDDPNKPLTPLSRFYKRLCGIISNASQPLLEALNFQTKITSSNLSREETLKAFEIKERLFEQLKAINSTIKHANLSIPQEIVEEVLLDAIISSSEQES